MSRQCDHCRFHKYAAFMTTTECWLWIGTFYTHRSKPTYGQFWYRGKRIGAHVASYLIHVGAIPDGLDILHSCDIKACVNPAHLRPGTHTENLREAFAKFPPGRFAGENAGHVRLTWAKVHEIRRRAATGERQASLAVEFGVAQAHISHIVRGTRWIEQPAAEAVA